MRGCVHVYLCARTQPRAHATDLLCPCAQLRQLGLVDANGLKAVELRRECEVRDELREGVPGACTLLSCSPPRMRTDADLRAHKHTHSRGGSTGAAGLQPIQRRNAHNSRVMASCGDMLLMSSAHEQRARTCRRMCGERSPESLERERHAVACGQSCRRDSVLTPPGTYDSRAV